MNTTTEKRGACVREGYQVLLRAEAEILLPDGKDVIGNYYRLLVEKCMSWATDVHGERIRQEFLSLEDLHDRALWRAQKYRFFLKKKAIFVKNLLYDAQIERYKTLGTRGGIRPLRCGAMS